MNQPVPWPPDLAMQQTARAKLIAYMKSHGRGAPWLKIEIEDRLPSKQTIALSTLQRFLRGERVNPNDAGFFCAFAAALPLPDPIGEAGRALAKAYTGDLNAFEAFEGPDFRLIFQYTGQTEREDLGAVLERDDGFFRLTEKCGHLTIARGVMAVSGVVGVAFLQTIATRSAKNYMIPAPLTDYHREAAGFGTVEVFDPTGESNAVASFTVEGKTGPRRIHAQLARDDSYGSATERKMPEVLQKEADAREINFDEYTGIVSFMARAFKRLPAKKGHAVPDSQKPPLTPLEKQFLKAAADDDAAAMNGLKDGGVNINVVDERTGLTALHLIAATDHYETAFDLIGWGVKAVPDGWGRLPSVVAMECGCTETMCNLLMRHEIQQVLI